jgi:glycogen debranching enzyme
MFEVSRAVEHKRLPELFCGFHKRPGTTSPTEYPVACAPQAWAAGSVYLLLRACLGMSLRAPERQLCFSHPLLPEGLEEVKIENLRLVDASVDLLVHSYKEGAAVEILREQGPIEIVKRV